MNEPLRQPVYLFEGLRLDANRRVLHGADGQPTPLTPRLFDTLLYFVERAGQLLTKEQLMEALWPRVVVEEHNLNKTVSELRRVLGEKPGEHKFIVTKPGHGYRFVADVAIETHADTAVDKREADSTAVERSAAPQIARSAIWTRGLAALGTAAFAFIVINANVVDRVSTGTQGERDSSTAATGSLAVLPFVDLSSDGDQAWLVDGFAEQILNSLARLPELKVTARTSSFQFRDEVRDIREMAERLGVANVLEGSVQSVGDELRVTAQLIRAADGFHVWSNKYDGTTADVFAFQRDVAERVAVALDIVLDEGRRSAMFVSGTQDVEAFREYHEGWRIYNVVHGGQSQQTLWDANRHFERALALDPKFALAAVGRTDAFTHFLVQPTIPFVANSPYSREEAEELMLQTFDFIAEHSPTSTMRLATQIQRESFSSTWDRMPYLLAELRRLWDVNALTFDSGVDGALWLPTNVLWLTGNNDLVRAAAEKHVMTDPLSLDAWIRRVTVELYARDFDAARAALAEARRNVGLPGLPNAEFRVALLEGDRAKAFQLLQSFPSGTPEPAMVAAAVNGDYATAMSIADELEKRLTDQPLGPFWGGLLYTYYEVGAAERASALVKRIDESPAGIQIFMMLLADNGGARYFDLDDAPNFVAKLKQVHVDPESLLRTPRLSARQ